VEGKTNNKIHDLIPAQAITEDTKLVLVNAVYFNSRWQIPFEISATVDGDFATSNGETKTARLMDQIDDFNYMSQDTELGGSQLLELPYKFSEVSMIVILPKKETGLQSLENNLTSEALESALNKLQTSTRVHVTLPKFKVESSFSLADRLKSMGIKAAFDGNAADFSGISSAARLTISKVEHKVFVDVDEKGTEAAAATAVLMMAGMAMNEAPPPPPIEFRADHPFLFLIRHNQSKAILFFGRVTDPTASI